MFKLKKTVAKLQESLVKKDEKINELTERLSKLEKRSGGGSTPGEAPLMSSLFSDKTTEAELQILAKVHREINKTTKIKANIIVSGLPAATGGTEDEKKADDKSRTQTHLRQAKLRPRT